MQSRKTPIIFYFVVLVTLACQFTALDLLSFFPAGSFFEEKIATSDYAEAFDSDPVFWEIKCEESQTEVVGREVTVARLFERVEDWSDRSRSKLIDLLLDRTADDQDIRLAFRDGTTPGEVSYVQLSPYEVRSILSALHVQS